MGILTEQQHPHCSKTRSQKPAAYKSLLATLDKLKDSIQDLQAKQFTAKAMYQALTARKKLKPKAEMQWLVILPQPPTWPEVWASCHKGLNTGQENKVSYLVAHRVVKTSAYLKFKCGMKSVSEFCASCGQIEDFEHLFSQLSGCGKYSPLYSKRLYPKIT